MGYLFVYWSSLEEFLDNDISVHPRKVSVQKFTTGAADEEVITQVKTLASCKEGLKKGNADVLLHFLVASEVH